MPLTILDSAGSLPTARGDIVVCVPVYNAVDDAVACVSSLLAHTPVDVPLLICDDASVDDRLRPFLDQLEAAGSLRHRVHFLRHASNRGFVANVNDAFARAAPADVVVVNSDCVVTSGWLTAMRRAATSSTLVASVSVPTNHGTILSIPERNRPQSYLPQTTTPERAAHDIARTSLRLYPRIPTIIGHCFLVRRAALELVGEFDLAFSPGYGEEVDFSQRCVLGGLVHVVADDAFVLHKGSASFAASDVVPTLQEDHDRVISARYRYYDEWVRDVASSETGPLPRALHAARRALRGLSVTIDGRCLTAIPTGTQIYTLELITALAREGSANVRVVVPPDLGDYARALLDDHPVQRILVEDVERGVELTDVVHRPYQVSSLDDLWLLAKVGHRIVITHQDLIAYHNPGYASSYEEWAAHRRLTRHALALADGVVFISHSAADEAVAEELVTRERSYIVHHGTDHAIDQVPVQERPPAELERLDDRPFLLCLGTDFRHKNRVFALRLLTALRERHGWDGDVVLAGPHVAHGSSASEEAAYLALHGETAKRVHDVAAVDDGEKRWLMRNAAMVVYPTVHEGFGFIPFEAAEVGTPCAFAAQTSMAELFPHALALIEPWDAELTAERLIDCIDSPQRRAEHVRALRAAAAPKTWQRATRQLVEIYRQVATTPAPEARRLSVLFEEEREALERRTVAAEARWLEVETRVEGPLDQTALDLLGSQGVPPDLRRPLLAITSRRALSAPLFAVLRLLYRVAHRVRHPLPARR